MKALKIIGITLLVLVVIFFLAGLFMPKEMTIERTVKIKAPKEVIFANLSNLKEFSKWDPWAAKDSQIKVTFEGEEGKVGQKMSWESQKVGTGTMEIASMTDAKVSSNLHFIKPFDGQADASFEMSDAGNDEMEVKWTLKMGMNMFMRVLAPLMGAQKEMETDFDNGLNTLKKKSEADAISWMEAQQPKYEIAEADMPEMTFMGMRKEIVSADENALSNDIGSFYRTNLQNIYTEVQKNKLTPSGPPAGIFYSFDMQNHKTDMAAAVPVDKATKDLGDIKMMKVPAAKWLSVNYYGAYDKVAPVYEALGKYAKDKGYTIDMAIEQYMTDPMNEKDTSKWLTKVSYVLKK